jgi:hypothetical protein
MKASSNLSSAYSVFAGLQGTQLRKRFCSLHVPLQQLLALRLPGTGLASGVVSTTSTRPL